MANAAEDATRVQSWLNDQYLKFLKQEKLQDSPYIRLVFLASMTELLKLEPKCSPQAEAILMRRLDEERQSIVVQTAQTIARYFMEN
jgi:hypothetical protein